MRHSILIPKVISRSSVQAVSLDEIKEHLRITHDDEDGLLEIYRAAAVEYYEIEAHRTLMETELQVAMDLFPAGNGPVYLPRATPLISVTWVKYKDSTGTDNTLSTQLYVVDTDAELGKIAPAYDEEWPDFTAWPVSPIRIRYKAGIAVDSPQTYPSGLQLYPVLLLIGGMYENRESETVTDKAVVEAIAMQYGVKTMIQAQKTRHAF